MSVGLLSNLNNFLESKYGWISAREKEEMEKEEVEDFLKLGLATHSLLQNIINDGQSDFCNSI